VGASANPERGGAPSHAGHVHGGVPGGGPTATAIEAPQVGQKDAPSATAAAQAGQRTLARGSGAPSGTSGAPQYAQGTIPDPAAAPAGAPHPGQ